MKVKILNVYELNGILRVETECEFGKDNIGLSLDAKYKDHLTGEPRWKKEVEELLNKKYNPVKKTIDEFKETEMEI
jgi:hypothetical protein